jgi:hypothetical protein
MKKANNVHFISMFLLAFITFAFANATDAMAKEQFQAEEVFEVCIEDYTISGMQIAGDSNGLPITTFTIRHESGQPLIKLAILGAPIGTHIILGKKYKIVVWKYTTDLSLPFSRNQFRLLRVEPAD